MGSKFSREQGIKVEKITFESENNEVKEEFNKVSFRKYTVRGNQPL